MNRPLDTCDIAVHERMNTVALALSNIKEEGCPKEVAFKKLSAQILEIGQTDPERASRLSKKLAFCDCTFKDLKELKELGLDVAGIPPSRGLPGGGKGEWIMGPTMCLSGDNHDVQIFHIPEGYRYRNYRKETWRLSRGSSCSVTYVAANSKDSIEKLKNTSNNNQLKAALSAIVSSGGDVHSVGLEGDLEKNTQKNQQGGYNATHAHAALVVSGETVGSCIACMPSQLDVAIEILLECKDGRAPRPMSQLLESPSREFVPSFPLSSSKGSFGSSSMSPFPVAPPMAAPAAQPLQPFPSVPVPQARWSSAAYVPPTIIQPINSEIPPEEACPLIKKKLDNPQLELSLDHSIEVLTTCIRYGNERARRLSNKQGVIVIGNTGAGKSTFVNYLGGCTLRLQSPKELGVKGVTKLITVQPPQEGGTCAEIMPIGHTKQSKTFMPHIETIDSFTYCDCPGFLDSRGAEINIANAVNIKNAIIQAQAVKVIVLINYHSLLADRARGLAEMLSICSHLFGKTGNIEHHHHSLLLGISNAPADMDLQELKEWIVEDTPPIMKALSQRLFIYDPLDRPLEGGWSREQCLQELETLPPIEHPAEIFKTVLGAADEKKLLAIGERMGEDIQKALKKEDFVLAASRLNYLETLTVIEHVTIERLLNHNRRRIERHFQTTINTFKDHCNAERFEAAQQLLKELTEAEGHFTGLINLREASEYYITSQERCQQRWEAERKSQEELHNAKGQIQQLIALLEEQKQATHQQLQEQEARYRHLLQEMEKSVEDTKASYTNIQQQLQQELDKRLAEKDVELALAKQLNQKEQQQQLAAEKNKLEKEYQQKIRQTEREKEEVLKKQQAQQAQREQQLAKEQAELKQKIANIDSQQSQQAQKLASNAPSTQTLPKIAFGKADWETYFGDVGEEPPLPANFEREVLQAPCPFWGDEGKTIGETHLLVLIPGSVNGAPLTLDRWQELAKKPRYGERTTQYYVYQSDVEREHGTCNVLNGHWVLMTRECVPNTFNKTYNEQRRLVKSPYEPLEVLPGVIGVMTHYLKTGEYLYEDKWSRCLETTKQGKFRVHIGGFSYSGLDVSSSNGSYGLAGFRRIENNSASTNEFGGYAPKVEPKDENLPRPFSQQVGASSSSAVGSLKPSSIADANFFGQEDWERYFGTVGNVPPPPSNIDEILMSPCPYWSKNQVKDTHLLVLIPKTVNGAPLTLDSWEELTKKPRYGERTTQYSYYNSYVKNEHGTRSVLNGHWVLMTRECVPNSFDKEYSDQERLVKSPYEPLEVLPGAIGMMTHYLKTGEYLYANRWSCCLETKEQGKWRVRIGGFSSSGLDVGSGDRSVIHGLAVVRKF